MNRNREIIIIDSEEKEIDSGIRAGEVDTRVQNREIREVIADMKAVMREKGLISLSATALGYKARILCIKFDGDIKVFINPIIGHCEGLQLSRERCEQLPGKEYILPRNSEVEIYYQKVTGKPDSRKFIGAAACLFQHELNHLDGSIISDFGMEVPEGFDDMGEEERLTLIREYLDTLDLKEKEIKEEVESDEESKRMFDSIRYMEAVARGEVELAPEEESACTEE